MGDCKELHLYTYHNTESLTDAWSASLFLILKAPNEVKWKRIQHLTPYLR
jgi:hypothetical protein